MKLINARIKSIVVILLFCVSNSFGQSYNFLPIWKVGQLRFFTITQSEKEFVNDTIRKDSTTTLEIVMKVLSETNDSYSVELVFENVALKSVLKLYEKVNEEVKPYKTFKLVYKVSKKTGDKELVNYEEAQTFMKESIQKVGLALDKKYLKDSPLMKQLMDFMNGFCKDRKIIDAYMDAQVGWLFVPYNKNFTIGSAIKTVDFQVSPIDTNQKFTATNLLTLQSVNSSKQLGKITRTVEVDLKEFKNMMKIMFQSMTNSFGIIDSSKVIKALEFDIDIKNLQEVTYDIKTSWVTQSTTSVSVLLTDPINGRRRKESLYSVLVK